VPLLVLILLQVAEILMSRARLLPWLLSPPLLHMMMALLLLLLVDALHRYRQGQLVEVNAHSLFSKWFSESGKLVSKLFSSITELVEEEDTLVFVLIDEVESLTSARKVSQHL
jgi:hypothetical protein